jgi:hypothetical protein
VYHPIDEFKRKNINPKESEKFDAEFRALLEREDRGENVEVEKKNLIIQNSGKIIVEQCFHCRNIRDENQRIGKQRREERRRNHDQVSST